MLFCNFDATTIYALRVLAHGVAQLQLIWKLMVMKQCLMHGRRSAIYHRGGEAKKGLGAKKNQYPRVKRKNMP
jgi:hypothetical protein